MTALTIDLPDDLEQRARQAGLLTADALRQLLEDAMRRQAGRQLRPLLQKLHAANIPPMSMDEIDADVKAVRAAKRAARGLAPGADRP